MWLVPLASGEKSRLTFTHVGAISGAFSPDGSRFASSHGLYGQAITIDVHSLVRNQTEKVIDTSGACILSGWSPDGKYLIVDTQEPKTGFDVQKIDVATRTMTPVVHGPADEVAPALSPNGKWLAYVSLESGAPEIYLTGFPDGSGKWQATPDGGNAPRWSRDGKKLFYVKGDRLMVADFRDVGLPQFGRPATLPVKISSDRIFVNSYSGYAVTSDGRFITTRPSGPTQPAVHLVTNWSEVVGR